VGDLSGVGENLKERNEREFENENWDNNEKSI
jgi:hypothetical protein